MKHLFNLPQLIQRVAFWLLHGPLRPVRTTVKRKKANEKQAAAAAAAAAASSITSTPGSTSSSTTTSTTTMATTMTSNIEYHPLIAAIMSQSSKLFHEENNALRQSLRDDPTIRQLVLKLIVAALDLKREDGDPHSFSDSSDVVPFARDNSGRNWQDTNMADLAPHQMEATAGPGRSPNSPPAAAGGDGAAAATDEADHSHIAEATLASSRNSSNYNTDANNNDNENNNNGNNNNGNNSPIQYLDADLDSDKRIFSFEDFVGFFGAIYEAVLGAGEADIFIAAALSEFISLISFTAARDLHRSMKAQLATSGGTVLSAPTAEGSTLSTVDNSRDAPHPSAYVLQEENKQSTTTATGEGSTTAAAAAAIAVAVGGQEVPAPSFSFSDSVSDGQQVETTQQRRQSTTSALGSPAVMTFSELYHSVMLFVELWCGAPICAERYASMLAEMERALTAGTFLGPLCSASQRPSAHSLGSSNGNRCAAMKRGAVVSARGLSATSHPMSSARGLSATSHPFNSARGSVVTAASQNVGGSSNNSQAAAGWSGNFPTIVVGPVSARTQQQQQQQQHHQQSNSAEVPGVTFAEGCYEPDLVDGDAEGPDSLSSSVKQTLRTRGLHGRLSDGHIMMLQQQLAQHASSTLSVPATVVRRSAEYEAVQRAASSATLAPSATPRYHGRGAATGAVSDVSSACSSSSNSQPQPLQLSARSAMPASSLFEIVNTGSDGNAGSTPRARKVAVSGVRKQSQQQQQQKQPQEQRQEGGRLTGFLSPPATRSSVSSSTTGSTATGTSCSSQSSGGQNGGSGGVDIGLLRQQQQQQQQQPQQQHLRFGASAAAAGVDGCSAGTNSNQASTSALLGEITPLLPAAGLSSHGRSSSESDGLPVAATTPLAASLRPLVRVRRIAWTVADNEDDDDSDDHAHSNNNNNHHVSEHLLSPTMPAGRPSASAIDGGGSHSHNYLSAAVARGGTAGVGGSESPASRRSSTSSSIGSMSFFSGQSVAAYPIAGMFSSDASFGSSMISPMSFLPPVFRTHSRNTTTTMTFGNGAVYSSSDINAATTSELLGTSGSGQLRNNPAHFEVFRDGDGKLIVTSGAAALSSSSSSQSRGAVSSGAGGSTNTNIIINTTTTSSNNNNDDGDDESAGNDDDVVPRGAVDAERSAPPPLRIYIGRKHTSISLANEIVLESSSQLWGASMVEQNRQERRRLENELDMPVPTRGVDVSSSPDDKQEED